MKRSLSRDSARKRVFRGALAALWLFGSAAGGDEDAEHVHDLRAAGTILSLEHFIADARGKHPGRIIDAKLHYEQSHGHYVYEILILDRRGEVWELEYDAHNGVLIERELGGD
jgi:uncharacterized membrane protein YkoI